MSSSSASKDTVSPAPCSDAIPAGIRLEPTVLIRVAVRENARHGGAPLFDAIARRAHDAGLYGAAVFRGIMGFGPTPAVQSAKLLEAAGDMPVVIELLAAPDQADPFVAEILRMEPGAIVTTEMVRLVRFSETDAAR